MSMRDPGDGATVDRCVESPEAEHADRRPAEDPVVDGPYGWGAELASNLMVRSWTEAFAVRWTHVDEILRRLEASGLCLACALYLDTRDRSAPYRCVAASPGAEELRRYAVDDAAYQASRAVLLPREGVYPAVELGSPLSRIARAPAERCWVMRYPAQRSSAGRPLLFAIARLAPESMLRGGPDREPDVTLGDVFAEIFAVVAARVAGVERSLWLRQIDELHATLAHDLSGPFKTMGFALDLLEGDKQGSEHGRQALARSVARVELELQNVLHYFWRVGSQIAAGDVQLFLEVIDPRELIGRAFDRPGVRLEMADIFGEVRKHTEHVLVVDERCLSLALANVLNRTLGSGTEVLVHVRSNASEAGADRSATLTIEVRDHGRGILDDCNDADRSPGGGWRAAGSAGLGLHLAKTIIEEHGGRLHADAPAAIAPDARVTIELPLYRRR